MITHKFREVMAFADEVTVLRRGQLAGEGRVADLSPAQLAEMMVGAREIPQAPRGEDRRRPPARRAAPRRATTSWSTTTAGSPAVAHVSLSVRPGEIVGIAGVSGNGQRELVEALIGQRPTPAGEIRVNGKPLSRDARRDPRRRAFSLPEEPLRNACVPGMSVAENMALRNFDGRRSPRARGSGAAPCSSARAACIARVQGEDRRARRADRARSPAATCSARCSRASCPASAAVLIAANPVFGLDFAAVAEIHDRILAARNAGAAVLLVSEDLDELLELSDRILVMFDGRIVHETAGRGRRHRRDRPRHGRPRRPRQDGVAARAAAGRSGSSRPARWRSRRSAAPADDIHSRLEIPLFM